MNIRTFGGRHRDKYNHISLYACMKFSNTKKKLKPNNSILTNYFIAPNTYQKIMTFVFRYERKHDMIY